MALWTIKAQTGPKLGLCEKQRTYSFLTQEKIEDYFKGVICGDIDDIGTRKR